MASISEAFEEWQYGKDYVQEEKVYAEIMSQIGVTSRSDDKYAPPSNLLWPECRSSATKCGACPLQFPKLPFSGEGGRSLRDSENGKFPHPYLQ
jgi:hypothetical protein